MYQSNWIEFDEMPMSAHGVTVDVSGQFIFTLDAGYDPAITAIEIYSAGAGYQRLQSPKAFAELELTLLDQFSDRIASAALEHLPAPSYHPDRLLQSELL